MREIPRWEVLAKKRGRYARLDQEHKAKIIDEVVEHFGYHRKAEIRALRSPTALAAPFVRGQPKEYDAGKLLPPLRAIWLAALQPCGDWLKAALPECLHYMARQETISAPARLNGVSKASTSKDVQLSSFSHCNRKRRGAL